MLIQIIHNSHEAMDVLFMIKVCNGTIESMTMLEDGTNYRTLIFTKDKSAVEGLESHMVGVDKVYTLWMGRE